MRKRWFKALIMAAILVLFIPFLICLFLVFERVRGRISLSHYKRELIAKGEKLSPNDFKTPPSGPQNGAPEIMEAIKQLKEGVLLPKSYAPRMKLTASGRA